MGLLVDTNISEEHTAYIFSPEDKGSMFLQNVGIHLQTDSALQIEDEYQLTISEHVFLDSFFWAFFLLQKTDTHINKHS
jgi:hypothetical protein